MIITFDDGHIKNYELLPVFKKHHVPNNIFMCFFDTNRHFWFNKKLDDDNCIKFSKAFYFRKTQLQHQEYESLQALNSIQIKEMTISYAFSSNSSKM